MSLLLILYALLIAITAVIYRRFLAHEEIMSWWFRFGDRYFRKWFFYKAIWGCEYCFAGQLALWTYLLNALSRVILPEYREISRFIISVIPEYHLENWSLFGGVIFVCLTIFLVGVINFVYTKVFQD